MKRCIHRNSRYSFVGWYCVVGIGFFLTLFSCSTFGFPSGRHWSPGSGKQKAVVELGMIRVDKNADWDSVEAETKRLLPLMLAENGIHADLERQNVPVYKMDVFLIEREFMENWKTRRSLSAEILIWKNETSDIDGDPVYKLAAAGKALLSGNKSLSSSKVLYGLLKLALSNALKAL